MLRNSLHGVFSVYKPKGWYSREATNYVQHALSNEILGREKSNTRFKRKELIKIGHGGTLDPIAEGVLVLGIGNGCKELTKYLEGSKEYIVTARLGQATDTYDVDGKIVKEGRTDHLTSSLVKETLSTFKGQITQVPPIYSALKMNGKRLYDYARENIPLPEEIKPRVAFVKDIELLNYENDTCVFRVECGGGTYMRSIVHDMAIAMGTFGHMTALKRTKQGLFTLDDTLPLDWESISLANVKSKIEEKQQIVNLPKP